MGRHGGRGRIDGTSEIQKLIIAGQAIAAVEAEEAAKAAE